MPDPIGEVSNLNLHILQDEAHLGECLPSIHKALGLIPALSRLETEK